MENENIVDATASYENNPLTVSAQAAGHLEETRKWSKFLAILGFCFVGLAIVAGLFAGTFFSMAGQQSGMPFPAYFLGIMYAAMAVVYFFPLYYLFRFSAHMKVALRSKSSRELDQAFRNLKAHYKYIGILFVVMLALYVLFGAGAMVAAVVRGGG